MQRAARRAAAVNRQAGDLEPEEVLQAFDTLAVQAVVHIAHANVATGQAHGVAVAFRHLRGSAAAAGGAVVGGGDVQAKSGGVVVGRAVADFVAEGRCVVFATVVHETDVARVNVGLGKLAVGGNVGPGATYLDLHHAIGRLDGQGVDGFVGGHGDGDVVTGGRSAFCVGTGDGVRQHGAGDDVAAIGRAHIGLHPSTASGTVVAEHAACRREAVHHRGGAVAIA